MEPLSVDFIRSIPEEPLVKVNALNLTRKLKDKLVQRGISEREIFNNCLSLMKVIVRRETTDDVNMEILDELFRETDGIVLLAREQVELFVAEFGI